MCMTFSLYGLLGVLSTNCFFKDQEPKDQFRHIKTYLIYIHVSYSYYNHVTIIEISANKLFQYNTITATAVYLFYYIGIIILLINSICEFIKMSKVRNK